jgi:hypothetical protein
MKMGMKKKPLRGGDILLANESDRLLPAHLPGRERAFMKVRCFSLRFTTG